jgi:large subunit ribosomal protein L21
MFAIIKTGGKQYRVAKGDRIVVEKLEGDAKGKVSFGEVLMLGEGEKVTVGAPMVAGASVAGQIVETRKGEKVMVFKKRRRSTYRRRRGHRQLESVVEITGVKG